MPKKRPAKMSASVREDYNVVTLHDGGFFKG
jgi:hypothetical protein